MAKKTKANLEFLLVKAEVKEIPEKALLRKSQARGRPGPSAACAT